MPCSSNDYIYASKPSDNVRDRYIYTPQRTLTHLMGQQFNSTTVISLTMDFLLIKDDYILHSIE